MDERSPNDGYGREPLSSVSVSAFLLIALAVFVLAFIVHLGFSQIVLVFVLVAGVLWGARRAVLGGRGRALRSDETRVFLCGSSLRRHEELLGEIEVMIPCLILSLDPAGQLLEVNRYWDTYTGCHQDQALHAGWLDVVDPTRRHETVREITKGISGGEKFSFETRIRRSWDGALRWHRFSLRPVFASNKIERWVGVATDIDDEKHLASALADVEERLDAS